MADFRKCFYALGLTALLAGLAVPSSATPTSSPPTIRIVTAYFLGIPLDSPGTLVAANITLTIYEGYLTDGQFASSTAYASNNSLTATLFNTTISRPGTMFFTTQPVTGQCPVDADTRGVQSPLERPVSFQVLRS